MLEVPYTYTGFQLKHHNNIVLGKFFVFDISMTSLMLAKAYGSFQGITRNSQ
jgi:hypothetical protein